MKRRATLALAVLVSPFWVTAPAPACAAESSHAGVVVRFDSLDERRFCVGFVDSETTGLAALRSTGLAVVTKGFGTMGEFVCKIGDVGTDVQDCPAADGSYWSYYKRIDGGWRVSGRGPASSKVGCGDVDGWAWLPSGKGAAPSSAEYAALCRASGCGGAVASAPPTRALVSSPTTRRTQPTASPSPSLSATPVIAPEIIAPAISPSPSPTVRVAVTKRSSDGSKGGYAVFGLALVSLIFIGRVARRKAVP